MNRLSALRVLDGAGKSTSWRSVVRVHNPRPIRKFDIRWNEPLGRPECPYMRRYILNLWLFSVRLHIWYRSDDKRHMHNHAFSFLLFVLKGSYTDVQEGGIDKLTTGSIRWRHAAHMHYVGNPKPGTVTLLFCGPRVRKWGFKVGSRIMRPLRYFSRYGHPACDEQ